MPSWYARKIKSVWENMYSESWFSTYFLSNLKLVTFLGISFFSYDRASSESSYYDSQMTIINCKPNHFIT
jgi:hypothetical protein